MKFIVSSLLTLLLAVSAHAGGFGGPAPFRNGSPLVTGSDGSYQAVARGHNLSGVFRFTYSDNRQTSNPTEVLVGVLQDPYNDYVIWAEGIAYRGMVQANVSGDKVAGVLDNGGVYVPNLSTATGTYLETFMSGYFNGKGNVNNPSFYFKGTGKVQTYIQDTATTLYVPTTQLDFRFSGVRNSLSTGS